ncbi:hypothetical protein [Pyrobaculum arsenaticum]|uniref:hypothetical protein n=1 Tax=Pyrobaculum arsenaticum TaxID=121277 RepID=UPI002409997B|nr:hypothetical protein [Pyrobaculum arsenaticum]
MLEEVLDNYVEPYIDLDRLVEIAKLSDELDARVEGGDLLTRVGCRIGVVVDSAFNFHYPELLEEAEALGEVVYLSVARDGALPPVDVLIVGGGGFPEVLAEKLERNKSFRKAVLEYVERGGRVYAECGGFMYMTSSIIVIDSSEYEMAGAIDAVTYVLERPVGKGYTWGAVVGETPVAPTTPFSKATSSTTQEWHLERKPSL